MPRAVLTGGPGAGKTTLLCTLAARGVQTVEESARALIAERKHAGLSARPEPIEFAREILRRDTAKFQATEGRAGWIFFDRGPWEAVGMLHEAAPVSQAELQSYRSKFAVQHVFVLPPWEAIYTVDTERDQTYAESVAIFGRIVAWYGEAGYVPTEVPRLPVEERARFVLRSLGISAA